MMQPGMHGARINKVRQCHLLNPPKPLVIWMCNDIQQERMINGYKTVHRVVYYFPGWHADEMLNLAMAIAKVSIRKRKH